MDYEAVFVSNRNDIVYFRTKPNRKLQDITQYRMIFETGMSGWRWYKNFLQTHEEKMIFPVLCDTYEILAHNGLIFC